MKNKQTSLLVAALMALLSGPALAQEASLSLHGLCGVDPNNCVQLKLLSDEKPILIERDSQMDIRHEHVSSARFVSDESGRLKLRLFLNPEAVNKLHQITAAAIGRTLVLVAGKYALTAGLIKKAFDNGCGCVSIGIETEQVKDALDRIPWLKQMTDR